MSKLYRTKDIKLETFRLESLRRHFVTDEGSRAETSQVFAVISLLTCVNHWIFAMSLASISEVCISNSVMFVLSTTSTFLDMTIKDIVYHKMEICFLLQLNSAPNPRMTKMVHVQQQQQKKLQYT